MPDNNDDTDDVAANNLACDNLAALLHRAYDELTYYDEDEHANVAYDLYHPDAVELLRALRDAANVILDDAPAAPVDDDHDATRGADDDVAAIIEQLARVATLNARTAALLGDTLAHVAALRAAATDEMSE